MTRANAPAVVLLATIAGLCGLVVAPRPAAASEVGELEQILRQEDGLYSKHGWNQYGPGYFVLDSETGVLTSSGGMGLFWYAAREYADFVLELEHRTQDERTNSGIFVRVPGVPTSDDYIYHSFEVQIDEAGEGIHATGGVYDAVAPSEDAARPPGEWNSYRISFVGDRITIDLNGMRTVDWQAEPRGKIEDFAARGYIGLQNHDPSSVVEFRNIRVAEIGNGASGPVLGNAPPCATGAQM